MSQPSEDLHWSEQNSQAFLDYGRYFVPERELQIELICDLVRPREQPFLVVELCCGGGVLAGALLQRFPACSVLGLDGSPEMLRHAQATLSHYGERFQTRQFELAARSWRTIAEPVQAVVSSLAIHHLDAAQKQALFGDVYHMLEAGGCFVVADVVLPASEVGIAVAAQMWDAAVRQRALEIDGDTRAFDVFQHERWNMYRHPDPLDKPSGLFEQLKWLERVGFADVDVFWMKAGHALFGGSKA
jgi:tRNA (cmo5U34)-methyltransferase